MVERDAPRLGQDKAAAAPLEQILPQRRLQRAKLGRKRRLRQVQPPRRAGEGAVACDRPKEVQMMQVEVHESSIKQNEIMKYM